MTHFVNMTVGAVMGGAAALPDAPVPTPDPIAAAERAVIDKAVAFFEQGGWPKAPWRTRAELGDAVGNLYRLRAARDAS